MAKDGTHRGGARPGAGRKKKALSEKIAEGKAEKARVLKPDSKLKGEDVPPPGEYLKSSQKIGIDLKAVEIYNMTYSWLKEKGCDTLVNSLLVERFALSLARFIQCEEAISEFGFLAKHPTTGAAISSPYVSIAQSYHKQANTVWYQIENIVKENCSSEYGSGSSGDLMEQLLKGM